MQTIVSSDLRELLDAEATRINSPAFIDADPVQFPRRFTAQPDIEIAALLSATIAWGNRRMICANCEKILRLMDYQPHAYILDEGYLDLPPELNIHRTFFARNLIHYLRGLRAIYTTHPTLADFARAVGVHTAELPAWHLVQHLSHTLTQANGGTPDSRCLPQNLATTALKRINMALRWLVRDDGIVDIGIWRNLLTPAQLYIPLDVHVGNTARDLGLLTRASNDRRAVLSLTDTLRTLRPSDPVFYDYALFGLVIEHKSPL